MVASWVAVLLLGCGGCKPAPERDSSTQPDTTASGSPTADTPNGSGTAPAGGEAEGDAPLLPVLNEEALLARVEAQRALLGGELFENDKGEAVPWISNAKAPPPESPGDPSIDDDILSSLPGSSGLGGPEVASAGRHINGNALGLFEPLAHPTEGAHPLKNFYSALRTLEAGNDPDGKVRILVYGGSHTDADIYPHYIRTYLQERFGNGGHGFVHIAKPWKWYGHVEAEVDGLAKWRTEHAQRRKGRKDGYYGLLGASLHSGSKKAWGRVTHRTDGVASHYEIYFLRQPRGGSFRVKVDGKTVGTVKTRASTYTAGYHTVVATESNHVIEVQPIGNGEVRLFGMTAERKEPGVVVDTLGIGGTRAANFLKWDETIWGSNVRRRDPDLVTLFYGTNEATDGSSIDRYEADLRDVITRIQKAAPKASCLLMGPGDFPMPLGDGQFAPRNRVTEIITVQEKVSAEMGCAFWDTRAFMGGELSMVDWAGATPKMARGDHIHFTRRGYVRIGMGVVDAIMQDFDDGPLAAAK